MIEGFGIQHMKTAAYSPQTTHFSVNICMYLPLFTFLFFVMTDSLVM